MEKKKLPIGIDDFKSVADSCYYIDKTGIISFLCALPRGTAVLFTRPRRFGKSLMLSMLETFFIKGEDNSSYFSDKKIASRPDIIEKYQNRFPVIFLNMKNVYGDSAESNLTKAKQAIQRVYRKYEGALMPVLSPSERKVYQDILSFDANLDTYSAAIRELSLYLHRAYGERVIILVDEYDTPIRYAFEKGYYGEIISFYKQLYGDALKGNADSELSIVTGILQVAKESLFSGLNNLRTYNVATEMSEEPFGFNESECLALLSYYGLEDKKEEVDYWYDGYLFGRERVYNPLSLLQYVDSGGIPSSYWLNTGENIAFSSLLSPFFESNGDERLSALLSGEEIVSSFNPAISYLDLNHDPEALLGYLVSAGYLSIAEKPEGGSYLLKIPNREISEIFSTEIKRRYVSSRNGKLVYDLKKAFRTGNAESLEILLSEYLLTGFSYYELGNEKSYQVLILVLSSLLFSDYVVKSEPIEGSGRADIIIYPKKKQDLGIVIEIKHHKAPISLTRLKESSEQALLQIRKKGYDESLKRAGVTTIIRFGVSFGGKNVKVASEIENR